MKPYRRRAGVGKAASKPSCTTSKSHSALCGATRDRLPVKKSEGLSAIVADRIIDAYCYALQNWPSSHLLEIACWGHGAVLLCSVIFSASTSARTPSTEAATSTSRGLSTRGSGAAYHFAFFARQLRSIRPRSVFHRLELRLQAPDFPHQLHASLCIGLLR